MGSVKKPRLPIKRTRITADSNGELFVIEVSIEQTNDLIKYPLDGIKAVFRIFKTSGEDGERELVVLIDNHQPFGYHEHDKLPGEHDSRAQVHAGNWQEAWEVFAKKEKEIIQ